MRLLCGISTWFKYFFWAFPILDRLHPLRFLHEFIMGQWYRWGTNPQRIKFILHFQEPLMVIRPVFRPGQIEGLVGSKEGGIKTILDIHLCCFDVEMVNPRCVLILIPVYEKLRVALVTQLEALEPARVAIVWPQRWGH